MLSKARSPNSQPQRAEPLQSSSKQPEGTAMDEALDALAEYLRSYIIKHERDPRLRTICLLLLEVEIERLRRMRLH
jgi:hypothetical protein